MKRYIRPRGYAQRRKAIKGNAWRPLSTAAQWAAHMAVYMPHRGCKRVIPPMLRLYGGMRAASRRGSL